MSDIKRMLQEAAENPRPLDLDRVHRVGRRRRQRPKLVVLGLASVILVAAAAGVLVTRDDSPAPHISAEPPTTGAAPTVTTSPSQSPAPRQMAWWVQTSDTLVIRVGDSAGGGFRTVAALSQQAVPLAMRADRMMYVLDTHLHGLELPSGRDTDYRRGAGVLLHGWCLQPGRHTVRVRSRHPGIRCHQSARSHERQHSRAAQVPGQVGPADGMDSRCHRVRRRLRVQRRHLQRRPPRSSNRKHGRRDQRPGGARPSQTMDVGQRQLTTSISETRLLSRYFRPGPSTRCTCSR